MNDNNRQQTWLVIVAFLGLAMLVRLPNLGRESLWFDEAVSYLAASLPVTQITDNAIQSSHPPLYYLLLQFWQRLSPPDDAALRGLGLLWNLALIPAIYWLGKLLFDNRRVALGAALLVAISPFHLLYSHELRMYTQLMTLTTMATAVTWQARHKDQQIWWVWSGLAWLAAVYTHLFALLALAAHGLFALWLHRERRVLWQTAVMILIVLLLFSPWLMVLTGESQTELGSLRPLTQETARNWLKPLTTPAFLTFGISDSLPYTGLALFLTLAITAVFMLEVRRIRRDGVEPGLILILLLLACTLGVPLLIYFVRPFFLPERTMAAGSPFLLLLLAWSTTRRKSPLPYLVYGTFTVFVLGIILFHLREPIKPPYREALAYVSDHYQPGDTILHTSDGSYLPALRYVDLPRHAVLAGDPDPRKPAQVYELLGGAVWSRADSRQIGDRLWLIVALEHSLEWQEAEATWFAEQFHILDEHEVGGITILLYEN